MDKPNDQVAEEKSESKRMSDQRIEITYSLAKALLLFVDQS